MHQTFCNVKKIIRSTQWHYTLPQPLFFFSTPVTFLISPKYYSVECTIFAHC